MVPSHHLETTVMFTELFEEFEVLQEGPPAKMKHDPITAAKCAIRVDKVKASMRPFSSVAVATSVCGSNTTLGIWSSHSCPGEENLLSGH